MKKFFLWSFLVLSLAFSAKAISIRGIDQEQKKNNYSVFQWPTNNWIRNTNLIYKADLSCVGAPSESGGHPNWRIQCTYIQGVDANGNKKYYGITAAHTKPTKDYFYKFVSADGVVFQNQADFTTVIIPPKLSWQKQIQVGTNTYNSIVSHVPDICLFEFKEPFPDYIKPARLLNREFGIGENVWIYGFVQSSGISGFGIYPSSYKDISTGKSIVSFKTIWDVSFLSGDSGSPSFYQQSDGNGEQQSYLVGIHFGQGSNDLNVGIGGVDVDLTDSKVMEWLKSHGVIFEKSVEGNGGNGQGGDAGENGGGGSGGGQIGVEIVDRIIINNIGPNSYSLNIDNNNFDSLTKKAKILIEVDKKMFETGPVMLEIKVDNLRLRGN